MAATASDITTRNPSSEKRTVENSAAMSWRSLIGINAANFFLAEVTGVALPFVTDFLKEHVWEPWPIGVATALAGLGVFLAQTPAGFITDRVKSRRALLAVASIILGACYALLPLVPTTAVWVDSILFGAGLAQSFFLPLLGALALGLVGRAGLGRLMGINQGFNHAGNLAAALLALALVWLFVLDAVFYAILAVSLLAAASTFLIRADEVDEERAAGDGDGKDDKNVGFPALFSRWPCPRADRRRGPVPPGQRTHHASGVSGREGSRRQPRSGSSRRTGRAGGHGAGGLARRMAGRFVGS